jgi:hypothetical protein
LQGQFAREFRNVGLYEPKQLEPELFFNRQPSLTFPQVAFMLRDLCIQFTDASQQCFAFKSLMRVPAYRFLTDWCAAAFPLMSIQASR